MSSKSRRGKKRQPHDGLEDYRKHSKDPLYADYCKQVITMVKKGRQGDLQEELLASCSPAAVITAVLELSEHRCPSWHWGCPVYASRLDRNATSEGVEIAPAIAGECTLRNAPLCLKDLLTDLGYDPIMAVNMN